MNKIVEHIINTQYLEPTLYLDIDQVEENYHQLKKGMPNAHIHYAVKANPHPKILQRLAKLGCKFDAASIGEIDMCLAAGATPADISFGNTVKKSSDIELAASYGITLFSADAEEELEKIATHAPRSRVFVRILIGSTEAEWPLSRKFGCSNSYAVPLMDKAVELGLDPVGLSFHVGSQTRHPYMWEDSLDYVSQIWHNAIKAGHNLYLLNIGGGFPAYYGADITEPEEYGSAIMESIHRRFGKVEYIMAEPGRGMVGNAGCISAQVLLVSKKTPGDAVRWVYLDVGRFSGLAETESESIKYQFLVPGKEASEVSECILAGPTCDSADVLYEKNRPLLPNNLKHGDKFIVKNCGAYTSTYSTVAFNGFPPLNVRVI